MGKGEGRGEEEWESEKMGGSKMIAGSEREGASGNGREAGEPQHLKVLNLWSR